MRLVIIIFLLFSCSKRLGREITSLEEIPRKNFIVNPKNQERLRKVDWKESFAKIFSKHIIQDEFKSLKPYPNSMKLKESIYYNQNPFEKIYKDILEEPSSIEVIEKKEKILSDQRTLDNLANKNFSRRDFFKTGAEDFVKLIENELEKENIPTENYFDTPIGQSIMDILQDTIFIILPGFGNHLIEEMVLPDLMDDINSYYGRNKTRPYIREGINQGFIPYEVYYGSPTRDVKFDILQPMGKDVGTTFSTHAELAKSLREWIYNLPSFYSDKKIVFIGYSKGATLALQILADFPDVRDRTRGLISLGGPLQGSTLAEFLSQGVYGISSSVGVNELKEELNKLPVNLNLDKVVDELSTNTFQQSLFLKNIIERIPYLPETVKASIRQMFQAIFYEDSRVILEGLQEEGTTHMMDWNLKYLNQEYFDRPMVFFNLSFLANFKDFLIKGPIGDDGSKIPPEFVPQFSKDGVDTKKLSLDSLSQVLISINNQEVIPGGLTDSMVNWNNSKFPIFDPLPLKETYTEGFLNETYQKNDFLKQNFNYQDFISLPRKEIFKKKGLGDMDFIDLGEVRGTHWSTMFRQVVRFPNIDIKNSHLHSFPHKSMMKSIIETYGIYKLIRDFPE